uniref:RING-type E3 ubiquitin transferase n=1 Tax=Davidia involucrata TaxID=16924 RepID=A0A5B6YZM9_DAVIN
MEAIDSPPGLPISSNTFFTPLLISMLGIISTSMAVIAYHFVLVKFCKRRRETSGTASLPAPGGEPAKGVEDKVLETIPILAYSTKKGNLFRVDQTECVICLGDLEDGDVVRLLPNCRHAFHVPCIDQWFMAHTSCPVCRSPIVAPPASTPPVVVPLNVVGDDNASTSAARPCGLLRHCASMALPVERKSRGLDMGIKRSLSMDQSHDIVIVDIQRESTTTEAASSSSSSSKADIMRSVSSKLLGSFSRLRLGSRGGEGSGILPY